MEFVTEGHGGAPPPKSGDEKPGPAQQQAPPPSTEIDMTQYKVQLEDLKSTISYMLFQEVPRRQVIDGDDLVGLKSWIHALAKYAPGTTPIRRLLYRMDQWLQQQGPSMSYDDWTKKLEQVHVDLGNPLPKDIHWLACKGSKPHLRGYTCGVWVLAHAMAAEAYKIEENNSTFKPVDELLEPFHQFIVRFLSCEWCAKNFRKEVVTMKMNEVATREEMVMWLWRVHNFVNKRLSGYHSDDPKFPKRQFPPSCFFTM
ncbi:Erv1 / Alr family protein [Oesophagostomum dentatum]|uniref:Sulfhydryl oxidase n=1 Tax=Oesophagostomum dentatum TaxID=61180 RepID=A0A0B1RVU2_OESDE|nr:Erv1 / Alr family protein [Oesophagostomum dentatum]